MKLRTSSMALLVLILSACRHSSYEFASSTVDQYGPQLEKVAMELSKCPPGSYVDGIAEYGRTGERCKIGPNSGAVRSVLLDAQVYWVVVGDREHATLFVVRDKRNRFMARSVLSTKRM